jgi:hypothetical protein
MAIASSAPLTTKLYPPCGDDESPFAEARHADKVTAGCAEMGGEHCPTAKGTGGVMSKAGNGASAPLNKLYYGDNLHWLEKMPPNTADLVYLDPPFNSQASYNILYHSPDGEASQAQYQAFEDSWSWDKPADIALAKIMTSGSPAAEIISALHN